MKLLTLLTILIGFYSHNVLSYNNESQAQGINKIKIKDAKVRAPIPGMSNTAGYMILTNSNNKNVTLVSAKSPLAKTVEFHDHVMAAGVMKMVKLDNLTIKPNEIKTFETGGLHLMFIDVVHSEAMQETINVTFVFSDGSEQVGVFNVKSIHQHHH